ncbi:chitosanase [Sorangium sp. So ce131]|uniref:chitosanase n=1 Tax=Sorangium sp. So ce131 TaxID=3133282 RepID=UPI003F641630
MHTRRFESMRGVSRPLALAAAAATLVACAADAESPEELTDAAQQGLSACSYTVTTNSYQGAPAYWGTITFTNTRASAMKSPQISFEVPSGVACDSDRPGWARSQSGTRCTFSSTSGLTIAPNTSYTFEYSTSSISAFTAANLQISDPVCGGQTALQKKATEALTSVWENDTPVIDYAFSANINDGRGYTSGRAGFCTGTGDAILVVQCYNGLRSAANGNLMAKYMPGLTTINNRFQQTGQPQASTAELDAIGSWTSDWAASYNSTTTRADFKLCQDQVNDSLYYGPAMDEATTWGLIRPLSRAALYDTFINQGESGARSIIASTNTALGNTAQTAPAIGVNGITEDAWLQKFLEKRRDVIAANAGFLQGIDRVAAYEKQRRRGNWYLGTAFSNDVRAQDCWVKSPPYPSSGYTVRTINPDGTWSTPSSFTYSCN